MTPLGPFPFVIEFLKVRGLFEAWGTNDALSYTSHNAAEQRAGLATTLLSLRAGPHRDVSIPAIRHAVILTRAVATCMRATADPPALVPAYFDAT